MLISRFLLLTFALLSLEVSASKSCYQVDQFGSKICELSVAGFIHQEADYQEETQWCWAASISMVFKHYNYAVSQETIVSSIKGELLNQPGYNRELNAALNRSWKDENGRTFTSKTKKLFKNWQSIFKDLEKNKPVIIGAVGHATVVIGAEIYYASNGQSQVQSVTISDPWPDNGGIRQLTNKEFNSLQYIARVTVQEGASVSTDEYIKKPKKWLKKMAGVRGISSIGRMKCDMNESTIGENIHKVTCNDRRSSLSCIGYFKKHDKKKYTLYTEGSFSEGYQCLN